MKKLYSYFKSFSIILLCSAGLAQGMEITVSQSNSQVPSLKQLCLDYIGQNVQQVNLMDNLVNLPADLASEAILFVDGAYVDQNKTVLIELAQSNELDRSVSCAIAAKTKDIALAYELAKSGPITDAVASIIINHFLNIDITTCLSDFDSTFNKVFSEDILKHGNEVLLYQLLMNKITDSIHWANWKTNDNAIFSMEDFENKNLSKEKIIQYVTSKCFINKSFDKACINGYIALSPCKKFIAFTEQHPIQKSYNLCEIHNLKTRNKVKIVNQHILQNNIVIDTIGFNKDSSHLGFLDRDGNMHSFQFASMLCDNISLQKLASIIYCQTQLHNKYGVTGYGTKAGLGHLLFESNGEINDEVFMLINFIKDNVLANVELLPVYISKELNAGILKFEHAIAMIAFLDTASEQLQMTKKELATQFFIDQEPQFVNIVFNIIHNNFDMYMIQDINESINYLYQYMGLFVMDPNHQ